ncbi:MAG: 16S rRNA (cytidine(1402)-2'-O)-methyltransferase [Deltaproteobacteria bacterium]|nr:MAG: 16S rRNA (cytidine(1402)-2'-O)-methyltransferase [Deltaproteobacteria bacterium]
MALWLVATPIGTLGDLSPRAREVLQSASLIAAEDTRRTRQLLSALDIPAPELIALHAHNEASRAEVVLERAVDQRVALVSDAGTPGISDPGALLVSLAHTRGIEIRSVPGPSALAAALAASGLPAAPSIFLGFPPRKGRSNYAVEVLSRPETLVFYEAPSRVEELVRALAAVDPSREACLCREISKKFEQGIRQPLGELVQTLAGGPRIRGECVLVVGPGVPVKPSQAPVGGDGLKDIAEALAARWGTSKRHAYQALLDLERQQER